MEYPHLSFSNDNVHSKCTSSILPSFVLSLLKRSSPTSLYRPPPPLFPNTVAAMALATAPKSGEYLLQRFWRSRILNHVSSFQLRLLDGQVSCPIYLLQPYWIWNHVSFSAANVLQTVAVAKFRSILMLNNRCEGEL